MKDLQGFDTSNLANLKEDYTFHLELTSLVGSKGCLKIFIFIVQ